MFPQLLVKLEPTLEVRNPKCPVKFAQSCGRVDSILTAQAPVLTIASPSPQHTRENEGLAGLLIFYPLSSVLPPTGLLRSPQS